MTQKRCLAPFHNIQGWKKCMTTQHGRLASPPAVDVVERYRTMHRTRIANSSAAAQCVRRRDSRMQQSSMTLGCICALLRPPRGAAWGGHVVADGWRHTGETFTPRRHHKHQEQQQRGASVWWRCDLKPRLGGSGSPRRGNRRPRVLMSVIVADGNSNSSGGGGGSIDEAAASASPPPFPKGEKPVTPRPLPPSQPPIPPRTMNGGAVDSDTAAGSAGRSTYINTGSGPQRRRPRPSAKQLQQQQLLQSTGGDQETDRHEGDVRPIPELEQQQQQQQQQRSLEIRRLGKAGRWRDALELLSSLSAPGRTEYVAAIAACDYAGEPRQALRVHALMVELGVKPTPVRGSRIDSLMGTRRFRGDVVSAHLYLHLVEFGTSVGC